MCKFFKLFEVLHIYVSLGIDLHSTVFTILGFCFSFIPYVVFFLLNPEKCSIVETYLVRSRSPVGPKESVKGLWRVGGF